VARSGYSGATRSVLAAEDDGASANFELVDEPESTLGANDGRWATGAVDPDLFPVNLRVQCGMVTQFTVVVHPKIHPECAATFTVAPFAKVSSGAFAFSLAGAPGVQGGVLTTQVEGLFAPPSASVTLGVSSFRLPCNGSVGVAGGLAQTTAMTRSGS
jgi:hypothetical protein